MLEGHAHSPKFAQIVGAMTERSHRVKTVPSEQPMQGGRKIIAPAPQGPGLGLAPPSVKMWIAGAMIPLKSMRKRSMARRRWAWERFPELPT